MGRPFKWGLASSVLTPFEAGLFDDDDDKDPDDSNVNPYQPNVDDDNNNLDSGYVASAASPLAAMARARLRRRRQTFVRYMGLWRIDACKALVSWYSSTMT